MFLFGDFQGHFSNFQHFESVYLCHIMNDVNKKTRDHAARIADTIHYIDLNRAIQLSQSIVGSYLRCISLDLIKCRNRAKCHFITDKIK